MREANALWLQILSKVKDELDPRHLENWFRPIKPVNLRDNTLFLELPSKFSLDWVQNHYQEVIKRALGAIGQNNIRINLAVTADTRNLNAATPVSAAKEKTEPSESIRRATKSVGFNPKYTFASFVIGPCNQIAHAASLAVSESPAKTYNPLFIYGGVGLGKTHLLQAIGQHLLQKNSRFKITYISSERFTNQLINSIQNRTTLKFREKYRNMDVLLIDDIHFIAGKESTQEEFFHTFNALHDNRKQIVLSSDRSPKDIPGLEERLVSRFEWGFVTDVQPPKIETRIAILRKKAADENLTVPDEVIEFIAERVKSNVRELEGALIRVVAYTSLTGKQINADVTQDILKDMLTEERKITIDLIQRKVAEYFDIRLSDMKVKKRNRTIAYPRQIAMYLTRSFTELSLPEIGDYFGGRAHTTIIHACNKIEKDLKHNTQLKNLLDRLIDKIKHE
jgi:chromosomal replication initiator protein